jgi:hypothetical protein
MSIVRIAASNPICTHEQLAALEFEPSSEFAGFDQNPTAMEEHEEKLRSIGAASRVAVVTLSKTKQDLIGLVVHLDEDKDKDSGSIRMLEFLTDARAKLEALLAFVTAAEVRFARAMANVDGNLPPIPKPPSEEIGKHHRRKLGL